MAPEDPLDPWAVGNHLLALILVAILGLSFLLAGCRDPGIQAVVRCGHSCWTIDAGAPDQGLCRPGRWVCPDDNEELATCEDQVGPEPETCDNQDNNCDGHIDENSYEPCSNGCGTGFRRCEAGSFGSCTAPEPQPEICNGRDDNCDGKVDEAENLPIEYCYEGPAGSSQYGICRPGSLRCQFGKKACVGQVLPRAETCNGADDDCDGAVDEGAGPGDPVDIVFIIDNSGSMGGTISAVKQAVASFTVTYGARTDLRWGLVLAPAPESFYDGQVRLEQNLTDATSFSIAVSRCTAGSSSNEPTLDALYWLCDSTNPMGIAWRPDSRHVLVLFTDEIPQSWVMPEYTVADTAALIASSQTRVYTFTDSLGQTTWAPVMPVGWGELKPLTSIASVMEMELATIIQENTCH